MKNKITVLTAVVSTALLLFSCGEITVSSATRIIGEGLAVSRSAENPLSRQTVNAGGSVSVTPINVSGEVASVGLMIGQQSGYNIFLLIGDAYAETGFKEDSIVPGADYLFDFDLADPNLVPKDFIAGDSGMYPSDADAVTSRIETTFSYLDFTFQITGTALASGGPYTLRLYTADQDADSSGTISADEPHRGDLLLKDGSTFKWIDSDPARTSESAYLVSARPASPVQHAQTAAYTGSADGMGGTIPSVSADIADSDRQIITWDQFTGNSWVFDVVFDMTDSMLFDPADIAGGSYTDYSQIDDTRALADAFAMNLFPDSSSPGFRAYVEATPSAAR